MHTKLHTENTFHARRCADKKPSRLHAPRAAIPAGTKISTRRKCEKRLLKINYPGSGNNSQFTYDGLGQNVNVVETTAGTVSSTKQFLWIDLEKWESRDASGNILSQYFSYGQTITGSKYYFSRDHLTSITEMTDGSGVLQAEYRFDPYGRITKLQGSLDSDFRYADYYFHSRSGLNISASRF